MQEQNKQLSKEIKNCDKYVKNWPAYKGLEDAVKSERVWGSGARVGRTGGCLEP